jgi:hypothetical protein
MQETRIKECCLGRRLIQNVQWLLLQQAHRDSTVSATTQWAMPSSSLLGDYLPDYFIRNKEQRRKWRRGGDSRGTRRAANEINRETTLEVMGKRCWAGSISKRTQGAKDVRWYNCLLRQPGADCSDSETNFASLKLIHFSQTRPLRNPSIQLLS